MMLLCGYPMAVVPRILQLGSWSYMQFLRLFIALSLVFAGLFIAQPASADTAPPQMTWSDGEHQLRLQTWHQAWVRVMEMNPDTMIGDRDASWESDVAMRRMRMLLSGQYERMEFVLHFGADNQTFRQGGAELGVIDAWGAFQLIEDRLTVGAGLHYWRGISRLTNNASTSSLALDPPILNWPTVGATDRVARLPGLFAKGQLGDLDYRLALNRPFDPPSTTDEEGVTDFHPNPSTFAAEGYFQYFFADSEPNRLPYLPATRLGQKKLFNLGLGFYYHPDSMASLDADGAIDNTYDNLALGADLFVEHPFANGSASTAYLSFYHLDMGDDYLRNAGTMNPGEGGSSLNGPGNAYPVIGTGQHLYLQAGHLFGHSTTELLRGLQLQPYLATQLSLFDRLDDPALTANIGANWYIYGQTAKVTTHYRNRPIFAPDGNHDQRASEFITQLQFSL